MKYKFIILFFALVAAGPIWAQNELPKKEIPYPYFAPENKTARIKNNYRKIQKGMTSQEVKDVLGAPDETLPLYEPKILNPKQIGHTHWFLIQRKCNDCSAKDKDEILVRVSYDLAWTVLSVDHWGFDENGR